MTNDLDAMQARCDAATTMEQYRDYVAPTGTVVEIGEWFMAHYEELWSFIAHARQDVPNLIAEIRELRKLLENKTLDQ